MGWELGEVVCATLCRTPYTVIVSASVCLHFLLRDLDEK